MYVVLVECTQEQADVFVWKAKTAVRFDRINTGGPYHGWYRFRVDPLWLWWFVDRCERHGLKHTAEVWVDNENQIPLQHNHAKSTVPNSSHATGTVPQAW